jgi:hypothetical protein
MYIYSLYVGEYFLFLLSASNTNPVKLLFRDQEIKIKGIKPDLPWREKIYLYPAILQRKWIDYKIKDKFIHHVTFDNILPCELNYPLLNSIEEPVEIRVRTVDKEYKNVRFHLVNKEGKTIYEEMLEHLTTKKENTFKVRVKIPGVYRVVMSADERKYYKSYIIFYKKLNPLLHENVYNLPDLKRHRGYTNFYCSNCGSKVYPIDTKIINRYIYKNYIPFKEYIDIEGLGMDFISKFIMRINHPVKYKKGLIHLLNIIRLASIEDELDIITSLFVDDPSFAYFITNRLFLFRMIPLIEDRELQKILNLIDDTLIARSMINENRDLISKVLHNISRRRASIIQNEMNMYKQGKQSIIAKDELHKVIKSYFEEHYGRTIRIPYSTMPVHSALKVSDINQNDDVFQYIKYHDGDYIMVLDNEILLYSGYTHGEACLQFDVESSSNEIFTIAGISEGTIYIKSEIGIRYALIHIYYWSLNIESSEFIENISRNMIIPLSYLASGLILTIGAISSSGTPHEQVIRLKVK